MVRTAGPCTSSALAVPSAALLAACRRTLTSTGTSILELEAKDVSKVIIPGSGCRKGSLSLTCELPVERA